jgi:hypothetical protein
MKVPPQDPVAIASADSASPGQVLVFRTKDETAARGCSARAIKGVEELR